MRLLSSAILVIALGVTSVTPAAAGPESPRLTRLSVEHGLSQSSVLQILQDRNRGLTRIDRTSGAMTHFGDRDGAQGSGYAEGAYTAGPSGLIYFAGEGVTAFDPREVTVSPNTPRILFTALEILHRPVAPRWLDPDSPLERVIDAQTEITLQSDATVFSVEMAPLHYADPAGNRLIYRLEGFDPDWIETGADNRVATYTNLAPGRYVLHARAGTKGGVWSEREATLVIHLLPPWWQTSPALALWSALLLVAAGLVWTAARRRARVKLALLERETLRRKSLTDPLTGLHNRRFPRVLARKGDAEGGARIPRQGCRRRRARRRPPAAPDRHRSFQVDQRSPLSRG